MKPRLICVSILALSALVKANLPVKLENGQIRGGSFWEVFGIPLGAEHGGKAGEKFSIWLDFGDKGLKIKDGPFGTEFIGFGLRGEGDGDLHAPFNNDPMKFDWRFKRVSGAIKTGSISSIGAIRQDGEAGGGSEVDLTESMFVTCAIMLTVTVPAGFETAMYDDPHIKTWGGERFDYHGECDLVLIHAPNFGKALGLDIHARTTIRYDYSYMESVAVRIADSILEVESFGQYVLDGVDNVELDSKEATLAGYPLYHYQPNDKQHVFDIVIAPHENITISTFKDLVSVRIHGGSTQFYGDTTGIMGSHDGILLARDGTTIIDDHNAFGQEWQVREDEPMLFRTIRGPQHPTETCRLPSEGDTTVARHLGESKITNEEAEKACDHLTGERKTACVFDVLKIGDLDIAQDGAH